MSYQAPTPGTGLAHGIARGASRFGDILRDLIAKQQRDQEFQADQAYRNQMFGAQQDRFAAERTDRADDVAFRNQQAAEARQREIEQSVGGAFERMDQMRTQGFDAKLRGPGALGEMTADGGVRQAQPGGASVELGGYDPTKDVTVQRQAYLAKLKGPEPRQRNTDFHPVTGALIDKDTGAIVNDFGGAGAKKPSDDMTGEQAKAVQFYQRGAGALDSLEQLVKGGNVPGVGSRILGGVPLVGNRLRGSDAQLYDATVNEFVTAILRKDSGATITDDEMELAKQTYVPQDGDSPETVQQKLTAARRALESIRATAGPGQSMIGSGFVGEPRAYSPDNPFAPTGG